MYLVSLVVTGGCWQVVDHQFVQSWRQQGDGIDGAEQLPVLTTGDLAGDENAQMADAGMLKIDDGASGIAQRQIAGIDVGYPIQCLLRWSDIVAIGAEHHHGCLDAFQVDAAAPAPETASQAVADEQVIDDHLDLLAVEQGWTTPPALEIEKAGVSLSTLLNSL